MAISSLHSQVDRVRSLLGALQNDLELNADAQQGQLTAEIEHLAETLEDWLSTKNSSQDPPETASADVEKPADGLQEPGYNEPWLGLALRQAHVGAWKWDLIHWTIQWSTALYEILGIDHTQETIRPETFVEMIHPDDRASAMEEFDRAVERGGPFYQEFRVVCPGGKTIWMSSSGTVEQDPSGRPLQAAGINQDITSRKQAEEALRSSEAQLRLWKDQLSIWSKAANTFFWVLDPDGAYQKHGLMGSGISGKPFEHTKGLGWIQTIHPEDREPLLNQWQHGIRQQKAFKSEARVWHAASQQHRWYLHHAVPLIEDGVLKGWVGASIDIQERKDLEQALREGEQRFQVALASAPIVVFSMDKDLRYTWVYNPRHELSGKDLLGKRGDEFLPAEDVAEFTAAKRSVIETGKPLQREVQVKIKGSIYNYMMTLDPLFDQQGQVSGLIGAALDVTEQRQVEAAQQEDAIRMGLQRHLLETREKERVSIAREIHDGPIQTLVGILFELQQVKKTVSAFGLEAELDPLGTSLKMALQELRQIINQLRPPVLDRFGLVRAIEEHAEEMREKFPELELRLELDESFSSLPEQISLTLFRICQEALNNTIRHAQAASATVRMQMDQDRLILEIKDDGDGFENDLDYGMLMENNHYGLAGMKERAEAIGGTFNLRSSPGSGTEVTVAIPLAVGQG